MYIFNSFAATMGLGLMPQIKNENPWGLSHLQSAYTQAHFAAQVAAASSGGGGGYASVPSETTLHHLSSSPSAGSNPQDLQNQMTASSTGSPGQHQQ